MKWQKRGVILAPDRNHEWMVSHASVPVIDAVGGGRLRMYFATRDGLGRSRAAYAEIEADRPERVLSIHDRPILDLGGPGSFDENGTMPSWLLTVEGIKFLYYIGWGRSTAPYRLAIGLAVSEDGGFSFRKVSEGPVFDPSPDPSFSTAPCVLHGGDKWRMWYVSCTGWETINGRPEPRYHVTYAESSDGFAWEPAGDICVPHDAEREAIGRPCVFLENGLHRMLYSYRSLQDYREKREASYRLGYADSRDGRTWNRRDEEAGIERSESGWDSEMIEYCTVHKHGNATYLFYNGNGFGRTGVGYAVKA
jgi:hypothetical protein